MQLDAQQGSDVHLYLDAGSNTSHVCHVADPSLRMCLDFEDPSLQTTIADLSARGHDGSPMDVQPMRRLNEQAAGFRPGADVHVDESPDLDIADNLTYEMWIAVMDPHEGSWPFDNFGQYTIGIVNDTMFCFANGAYADTTTNLGTNEWHHVACTYGNGKMKAYVDGKRVGCTSVSGQIANTNHDGTDLGQAFSGNLDDVHVYAAVLDEATLAAHANALPTPDPQSCVTPPV